MKKKLMALALCTIIAVVAIAGSSLAWLQDTTETVVNTFTEGKVDITLEETNVDGGSETENSYQMIPGNTIEKDPKVTVLAVSEACWLFVKVEENDTVNTFLTYEIADGWTELTGVPGVYYREVGDTNADQPFDVLNDNQVIVQTDVNMDQMNALTKGDLARPELKFTAYAIQSANITDANSDGTAADEAWALIGN